MKKIILLYAFACILINSNAQTIIQAQTGYYTNNTHYNWTEEWYKINGSIMAYWNCCANYTNNGAMKFAVFDSTTCNIWSSQGTGVSYFGVYGEFHCQNYNTPCYDFYMRNDDSTQNVVANFIDSIPQNDYVLMFSHQNHHCLEWNNHLINAFRSIGSFIDTNNRIPDGYPYIIFGRKGDVPGTANEVIGNVSGNLILLTDSLPCNPFLVYDYNYYNKIVLYPNPATTNLTVIASEAKQSIISIYNLQCQLIKQQTTNTQTTNLDISPLARGMYFVKVQTEKVVVVRKFVKE